MPAILPFDFYQRAYRINQAFATSSISLNRIKMGDINSPLYKGLAYSHTKSFYADMDSVYFNYELFNLGLGSVTSSDWWFNNFATSSTNQDHRAEYLANANIGPATPKLNQNKEYVWDQTCYPCALGDTRDSVYWNDYRDGSWVEAGVFNGQTQINIYQVDPNGSDPIWLNNINVGCPFNPNSSLDIRVFSSPSFNTNNTGSLGMGLPGDQQLIACFCWGAGKGGPALFYELFAWDPTATPGSGLVSVISYDLTNQSSFYDTFPYTGKHDIFYTAQWNSSQSYSYGIDFLTFFSQGGSLNKLDLASGTVSSVFGAVAGAYSDVYDVFCYADNGAGAFSTFKGASGPGTSISTFGGLTGLNIFDADYRPFPPGVFQTRNDESFYFGDARPGSGSSGIVGWSVEIDTSNTLSRGTILGVYDQLNGYIHTGLPSYTLNRVVVTAPMQLIVGPGPGLGTQKLLRITCGWKGFYPNGASYPWYKPGAISYTSASEHEDFIAMDHGYCEDYTGYFNSGGYYQSGYEVSPFDVISVGAGNQHILSVNSYMGSSLFSQNNGVDYTNTSWTAGGSISAHYIYALYLGISGWGGLSAPHNQRAYCYMNVTGDGNAFLNPTTTFGQAVNFGGSQQGALRILVFYA